MASEHRVSAYRRGYTQAWQKASKIFLARNPLCRVCYEDRHKLEPAIAVDHIIPHKGDMTLFWDESNWQSLCETCHNAKTARELHGKLGPAGANADGTPRDPMHLWNQG